MLARPLMILAGILLVSLLLGATGLLDDVADFIVQILRIIFDLLVGLINLFVRLIYTLVGWLRNIG